MKLISPEFIRNIAPQLNLLNTLGGCTALAQLVHYHALMAPTWPKYGWLGGEKRLVHRLIKEPHNQERKLK